MLKNNGELLNNLGNFVNRYSAFVTLWLVSLVLVS